MRAMLLLLCSLTAAVTLAAQSRLAGSRWELLQIRFMNASALTPDEPSRYTLALGVAGVDG
jgi:hypothetical protein